jgi:mitochondrial chaperone BCS1
MDFSKLLASNAKNGNISQSLHFAPSILEAVVPGYSLFSRFALEAFGFDIGIFVSIALLVAGLYTSIKYFGRSFSSFSEEYLISSVLIDDHDDLFRNILSWIAKQQVSKRARRLKAVSKYGSSHSDEGLEDELDEHSAGELFHFAKWAARTPPTYEPAYGRYIFFHEWRLFIFERSRRERQNMSVYGNHNDEEAIRLKTVGFSTAPIKRLLRQIKRWSVEQKTAKTTIRRPTPKEARGYRGNPWGVITTRHSRPMETVVLDEGQKQGIIDDLNEFLSPNTPRWYATRGIPYRRGYLFHGPPGTGKSSLSFALAGLFGLEIYVLSLLEPTLTEGDLNHLFNMLPKRCVVLLEDIDTAGLKREEKADDNEKLGSDSQDGKELTAADIAKELKKANRRGPRNTINDDTKQGISLSGLLNAIDGVASHEGRVLVMTTNHPENLDAALIRPGRVDLQIKFPLASRHQIEEIFFRMYWSEQDQGAEDSTVPHANGTASGHVEKTAGLIKLFATAQNGRPVVPRKISNGSIKCVKHHDCSKKQIRTLAEEFASLVPERKFSPAEIQNYLITRKKDPQKAVDEGKQWCEELLEQKKEGLL